MASSFKDSSNFLFSGEIFSLLLIFISLSDVIVFTLSGDSLSLDLTSTFSAGLSVLTSTLPSGVLGEVVDSLSEVGLISSFFWSSDIFVISVLFSALSAFWSVDGWFISVLASVSVDLDEDSSLFCCALVSTTSAIAEETVSAGWSSVSTFGGNESVMAVVYIII